MVTIKHDARGIDMQARLLEHIRKHDGAKVVEMVVSLKSSKSNLHHHLRLLAENGEVHCIRIGRNAPGTWHMGEDPTPDAHEERRPIKKTWPPHHFRDYLVAAFFGSQGVAA